MRILATGTKGQVVEALRARGAAQGIELIALGRPELDLERPDTLPALVQRVAPDAVISVAAYTAVDQAETHTEAAHVVNAASPGALAAAAAAIGAPIIHLSTDYVFDGEADRPYAETDPTSPRSVYGATKLAGEQAVMAANPNHVILRTAWVYSATGKNFVKTMLRLAAERSEIAVVADQRGNPTYAGDIADGVYAILRRLAEGSPGPYGVYHMTGSGEASWAEFARAIFEASATRGGPSAQVRDIATADYPTPAPRPRNSRLDCRRLAIDYGVTLQDWPSALGVCLDELIGRQMNLRNA